MLGVYRSCIFKFMTPIEQLRGEVKFENLESSHFLVGRFFTDMKTHLQDVNPLSDPSSPSLSLFHAPPVTSARTIPLFAAPGGMLASSGGEPTSGGVCRGVWRRQWEEDPLGDSEGADRDTLVLWTQSSRSGLYVDLRLPHDSPGRSLSAAESNGFRPCPYAIAATGWHGVPEIPPSNREVVLNTLCRHKSFAGVLIHKDGDTTPSGQALARDEILAQLARDAATNGNANGLQLCTCLWQRDIDYQPPTGSLDVGVCASEPVRDDGSVFLRETGADASYAEGWWRLPGTETGPSMALELVAENGIVGARKGCWVRAGNRFAYAVGRPLTGDAAKALGCHPRSHELASASSCIGQSLIDAVTTLADDVSELLDLVATYVAVAGEIESNGAWTIHHSTHPTLVGCRLVGSSGDGRGGDGGKDNDALAPDNLCCSTLADAGGVEEEGAVGREVIQQLCTPTGAPPTSRTWKVVELEECRLLH